MRKNSLVQEKPVNRAELLAPAGSYEGAVGAINAGADAIYAGGSMFGARAFAKNFSDDELISAINYAHIHGRKFYLTVNTLLKQNEIDDRLYDYIKPFYDAGLDAVIVQDHGVLAFMREYFPDMHVHASTQMTIESEYGAQYVKDMGASRLVLPRELSLEEVSAIKERTDLEIEAFVHGALCYCYSGQCLFSSMLGERSGNRGRCAQPCRLEYNDKYILSPKDICTIEILPKIIEAGVYSLKIEGRMKKPEYTAGVTAVYRKYLDLYLEQGSESYRVDKRDINVLKTLYMRSDFSESYFENESKNKTVLADMITLNKPSYTSADDDFMKSIYDEYVKDEIKLTADAYVYLEAGQPSLMSITSDKFAYTATSYEPEAALKQPLSEDKVKMQVSKTGDTFISFSSVNVDIIGDIFMPASKLNELRRMACDGFINQVLAAAKRREVKYKPLKKVSKKEPESGAKFAALVSSKEQLNLALGEDFIRRIYIEMSLIISHPELMEISTDKEIYIALPRIFRKRIVGKCENLINDAISCSGIKGFLVRNISEYMFIKENFSESELKQKDFIFDSNVYIFNSYAGSSLSWLSEARASFTLPLELSKPELKELLSKTNSEFEAVIYGAAPLMVSEGCIQNTEKGCSQQAGRIIKLKDRKNMSFPVVTDCNLCLNYIYNTVPTSLTDKAAELMEMGVSSFRIELTTESEKEAMRVLNDAKEGVMTLKEFTRGHYKRRVD